MRRPDCNYMWSGIAVALVASTMGGKRNNLATFRSAAIAAIAAAAIVFASSQASAESTRRVVITKFQGPEDQSQDIQKQVASLLEEVYDIIPYRLYRIEGRRLGAHKKKSKRKAIMKVCKRVGCDAIIYGELDERRLTVKVREGDSGRMIGKFRLNVGKSFALTDELEMELVELIDATKPVEVGNESLVDRIDPERADSDGQARARLASTAPPSATRAAAAPVIGPLARRSWDDIPPEESANSKPSPINLHAMVGLGGNSRSLNFNYKGGLPDDAKSGTMPGAPALAAAFTGVADFKAIGLSAEFNFSRSIGASAAYNDGAAKKTLSLKNQLWGARVFFRRPVSRRLTVRGGAGYHQQSFTIKNKPNGLRELPDTRYSMADLGVGARLLLRDDRVALTADAAYVHVIASSGITDQKAYGSAQILGVRGEAGIELEASSSTFIRVAFQYSMLRLVFDGSGELVTDLDDNPDQDLSAATDISMGGVAMMGFHF